MLVRSLDVLADEDAGDEDGGDDGRGGEEVGGGVDVALAGEVGDGGLNVAFDGRGGGRHDLEPHLGVLAGSKPRGEGRGGAGGLGDGHAELGGVRGGEDHHLVLLGLVGALGDLLGLECLDGAHAARRVGVEGVAVLLVERRNRVNRVLLAAAGGQKVPLGGGEQLRADFQLSGAVELVHHALEGGAVLPKEVEEIPLKVGGDANVHRRGEGLDDGVLVVLPGGEEAIEDVVGVGGDDEVADREAHPLGVVAGEDVTKVARGDGEGHLAVAVGEGLEVGVEVVGDLEHDARNVDRVDGPERVLLLELEVPEEGLDNVLAVVKGALHRHVVHVGVQHARHLHLLDGRHPALREQDEALDVLLAPQSVDRR
mmetsp:Transcript_7917/g.19278  ORF Transcript_7917/g.19278 Transcript_7917/m.19278 type:complete len:369 (-) Transcript_7917:584-1690(-)